VSRHTSGIGDDNAFAFPHLLSACGKLTGREDHVLGLGRNLVRAELTEGRPFFLSDESLFEVLQVAGSNRTSSARCRVVQVARMALLADGSDRRLAGG
jgi:hypothetical protein